jgi:hypothetical protein
MADLVLDNTLVTGNGESDMRGSLYPWGKLAANANVLKRISSAKRNDTISITVIAALPRPSFSDCILIYLMFNCHVVATANLSF